MNNYQDSPVTNDNLSESTKSSLHFKPTRLPEIVGRDQSDEPPYHPDFVGEDEGLAIPFVSRNLRTAEAADGDDQEVDVDAFLEQQTSVNQDSSVDLPSGAPSPTGYAVTSVKSSSQKR